MTVARPLIDARKARVSLDELSKTLKKRMEAARRYIVMRVAEEMRGEVERRAPSGAAGLPPNYPELEVSMVDDPENPAYAVVYVGRATRVGALDPATTVLYVKRLDEDTTDKVGAALAGLETFSPFAMDSLPASIPRDRAYFVSRTVRRDEVLATMARNAADAPRVKRIVEDAGLPSEVDLDAVAAYSDVVFQALRAEFGIGRGAKPHWRPAVRAVRDGETLTRILKDPDLVRTIWDPSFHGWHRLGMMANKISYTEVRQLREFEHRILD